VLDSGAMRKLAWLVVVLLFLSSAWFFLRYLAIYADLADPQVRKGLGLAAALAHIAPIQAGALLAVVQGAKERADFSLYMSIATGLLGALAFVILAATHRRRRYDLDEDDEEDPGPTNCPECDEPIEGFAITCRACGHRFGVRTGRRF
jgi:hypothetical protein